MDAKKAAAISALQEVIDSCDQVREFLSDSPPKRQSVSKTSLDMEGLPSCKVTAKFASLNLIELGMRADAAGLNKRGEWLFRKITDLLCCVGSHSFSAEERSRFESLVGPFPESPQDPEEAEIFYGSLESSIESLESELRRHAKRLIALLQGKIPTDPVDNSTPKIPINGRMKNMLINNPEAMGWNSPKWAEELKCAKSSVVETKMWKNLESARLINKAEHMKDRHRKPKASDQRRD